MLASLVKKLPFRPFVTDHCEPRIYARKSLRDAVYSSGRLPREIENDPHVMNLLCTWGETHALIRFDDQCDLLRARWGATVHADTALTPRELCAGRAGWYLVGLVPHKELFGLSTEDAAACLKARDPSLRLARSLELYAAAVLLYDASGIDITDGQDVRAFDPCRVRNDFCFRRKAGTLAVGLRSRRPLPFVGAISVLPLTRTS